jgi:1,4-alpha-glucan branching enzyme
MMSQANIGPNTPMGATLIEGGAGATFRVWAPAAQAVYVNGTFGGVGNWTQTNEWLMARDADGYWTGFVAGAAEADQYKFYVVGAGSQGYKRDPYARELTADPAFPHCNCIVRGATYPWHDSAFVTPDFSNSIIYQLHVGTYAPRAPNTAGTFLDVVEKLEYLVALGIDVLQPLPVDEMESSPSMGYNGSDLFSPDTPYVVMPDALAPYLATVDRLLAAKGFPPLPDGSLATGPNQLKALIDLAHLYGIAVAFDVVYNHAGGFEGDDEALYFWDRETNGDNNRSLYFTSSGWAGGLSFALWNGDVRQFLINSASYYRNEFHVDGFRYDEISALVNLNGDDGWSFCRDMTSTVRFLSPRLMQNAEFWPVDPAIVAAAGDGGAGFDVTQHDGLRDSVRGAVSQCSYGASAAVDMDAIARNLYPPGFSHGWQAVTSVENHDLVKEGAGQRLPTLADPSNHRSWYARSRSRVATAILMTAPGIPMVFMGQEFLEDKQWSDDPNSPDHVDWAGLNSGDVAMNDHLRFTQDLIRLRWRQPALRSDDINCFHVHDGNRVLAFQRWIAGIGRDVVVVASFNDSTFWGYGVGFPSAGRWLEVFNSDVYDNWVNPCVAGNGGAVFAGASPLHGLPASSSIVIPANGLVVFARDSGD